MMPEMARAGATAKGGALGGAAPRARPRDIIDNLGYKLLQAEEACD